MKLVKVVAKIICLLGCIFLISFNQKESKYIPLKSDNIEDNQVRADLQFIKDNSYEKKIDKSESHITLYSKIRTKENIIFLESKVNDVQFYNVFGSLLQEKRKEGNGMIFNSVVNSDFIKGVSFYHVKYMIEFDSSSFKEINKSFTNGLIGKNTTFLIKAFISSDLKRNYLMIKTLNTDQPKELFFIIKESMFYACSID